MRGDRSGFGGTITVTGPDPVKLAGDTPRLVLDAVHAGHEALDTLTETVAAPPPDIAGMDAGSMPYAQLVPNCVTRRPRH